MAKITLEVTAAQLNEAGRDAHTHNNLTTLQKLSEVAGKLALSGTSVTAAAEAAAATAQSTAAMAKSTADSAIGQADDAMQAAADAHNTASGAVLRATALETALAGGTTGQVLAKASNTSRDFEWVAQSGGGGEPGPEVEARLLAIEQWLTIGSKQHRETSTSQTARAITILGVTDWEQVVDIPLTIMSNATISALNTVITLNINGLGAKTMRFVSPQYNTIQTTTQGTYTFVSGAPYQVVYDGTYVNVLHRNISSGGTAAYGLVRLNNSLTSTSTGEAATANAVRLVNDKIDALGG